MSLEIFTHSEILAPFFFLIGLQLRNEITHIKEIALPSIAALGGMILPAIIFLSLNSDPEISNGWPLVMPTDIALVMLVLLALGKRVSIGLKTFLLALAVADDLLSILVLAGKYSGSLKISEVFASIGMVGVKWNLAAKSTFLVNIQVEALDRARLLSDVTKALSDQHVNILSAAVSTSKDRTAFSRFTFEMADATHLDSVLAAVRGIEGEGEGEVR